MCRIENLQQLRSLFVQSCIHGSLDAFFRNDFISAAPYIRNEFVKKMPARATFKVDGNIDLASGMLDNFKVFVHNNLTAENIEKRDFGLLLDLAARLGLERFDREVDSVWYTFENFVVMRPHWMPGKIGFLRKQIQTPIKYVDKDKADAAHARAAREAKKNARSAADAALRSRMKGSSCGGGKQQQSAGKKKGKK